MELVQEKKYPRYSTYQGKAYETIIQFTTLPVPLVMNWVAANVAGLTETSIRNQGGEPLLIQIFRRNDFWTWTYYIKAYFFFTSTSIKVAPAVAAIITFVIKALLVALLLWLIGNIVSSASEIIWGPKELPSWLRGAIPLAILIGVIAVGGGYLLGKIRERREV